MYEEEDDIFVTQSTFQPADQDDADEIPRTGKSYGFRKPMSEEELKEKLKWRVPKTTEYKNEWAVTVFARWQDERSRRPLEDNLAIPRECFEQDILEMNASCLNIALKYFIFEATKQDGTDYPSNTLYGLFAAFQSVLKSSGSFVNIFDDAVFCDARNSLDAVMKERSAAGLGASSKQSAQIITEEEENRLWDGGFLGDDNPRKLLDTLMYLAGLHFSLRGGKEHRDLRLFTNPQITGPWSDDTLGRRYQLYKQDVSKTCAGGLKQRKVVPKEVRAYDNPKNPTRCYVLIFGKFRKLCSPPNPKKADAFYYSPLPKPKADRWFSHVLVGHNTLQGIVKRLCQSAGQHPLLGCMQPTLMSNSFASKQDTEVIQYGCIRRVQTTTR